MNVTDDGPGFWLQLTSFRILGFKESHTKLLKCSSQDNGPKIRNGNIISNIMCISGRTVKLRRKCFCKNNVAMIDRDPKWQTPDLKMYYSF